MDQDNIGSEATIRPLEPLNDESHSQQNHMVVPPSNGCRKEKRARTEVTRTSMSYPRKRAVRACQLCRTRKTKCNNVRPMCGACSQINATCVYEDSSDHSSFDPASLLMLDRLNQIIDILHTSVVPGTFSGLQQQQLDPFEINNQVQNETVWDEGSSASIGFRGGSDSHAKANNFFVPINEQRTSHDGVVGIGDQSSMEYLRIPAAATGTNGILQWPIFEDEFPVDCLNTSFSISQDESVDEERESSGFRTSTRGFGIQEEEIEGLVEDFLAFVHIKNPILHPDTLQAYAQTVAENGPRWDAKSCLVYLTCSLGCLAQAFQLNELSDLSTMEEVNSASHDQQKLRCAEAYYNFTRKRIGLLPPSLITAHCFFFSGVYLMYIMQPLQGWHNFYQAATLTHMCLKSSTSSAGEKTIRLEQCLYWSCFKSECEMRGELPLAVSALGTIEYPHLFPTPPGVSTPATDRNASRGDGLSDAYSPTVSTPYSRRADSSVTYDEGQSWYYYLTEIALRRIGNRVLNAFYQDNFASWLNLSEQALRSMIEIANDFDEEISQRIDGLPESLRFNQADLSISPRGELAHVVRARVIEIQSWLCRPFLFYAIHHPANDVYQEAIRPFVDRALQYCVRIVRSVAHRHRHHGTWYALRSGTTACLLIIAAVRCGHLTPPVGWETIIRRHMTTLKYWESEAADIASARLILESLMKLSRTD